MKRWKNWSAFLKLEDTKGNSTSQKRVESLSFECLWCVHEDNFEGVAAGKVMGISWMCRMV
jgi:hypothetical protein